VASVRTRLLFIGAPLLVAAATAVVVVRFAGGSDGPGDPARFLSGLIQEIAANDYASAWATLHPRTSASRRERRTSPAKRRARSPRSSRR
jgi:hypothetical protein